VLLLVAVALAGCDQSAYTLYRNGTPAPVPGAPDLSGLRIHVATFDAVDREEYNRFNCEKAQRLFQAEEPPGAGLRYWCEKGHFHR
jgi:hypothetical protein